MLGEDHLVLSAILYSVAVSSPGVSCPFYWHCHAHCLTEILIVRSDNWQTNVGVSWISDPHRPVRAGPHLSHRALHTQTRRMSAEE